MIEFDVSFIDIALAISRDDPDNDIGIEEDKNPNGKKIIRMECFI